jgi:hypothetical protein
MLGSIGTKNDTMYNIGYGTIIGCPAISGVIGCGQLTCWLTSIGLVTKLGYIWVCCTCTSTWVANVLSTTSCKEDWSFFFINLFNLSSTKGQFLNSCPTCWEYAQVNATSIIGRLVVTDIFRWTNGHSTIFMTSTLGQTDWWNGCVY